MMSASRSSVEKSFVYAVKTEQENQPSLRFYRARRHRRPAPSSTKEKKFAFNHRITPTAWASALCIRRWFKSRRCLLRKTSIWGVTKALRPD